ncbi:hypothetical protein A2U01_0084462, partial [Trifolium medium]|nr:hypothetical protein [Trifolium medium]
RSIAGITDAMLDRFGEPYRVFKVVFRTIRGKGPLLGFLPRGVNVPSRAGVLPGVYYGDGASLSKVFSRRAYSRPIARFFLLSF